LEAREDNGEDAKGEDAVCNIETPGMNKEEGACNIDIPGITLPMTVFLTSFRFILEALTSFIQGKATKRQARFLIFVMAIVES